MISLSKHTLFETNSEIRPDNILTSPFQVNNKNLHLNVKNCEITKPNDKIISQNNLVPQQENLEPCAMEKEGKTKINC